MAEYYCREYKAMVEDDPCPHCGESHQPVSEVLE